MVETTTQGTVEKGHGLQWVVSCNLKLAIVEPAEVVIQVVAARSAGAVVDERFQVVTDHEFSPLVTEISGPDGARLQVVQADRGTLTVAYRAEIEAVLPDLWNVLETADASEPTDPYLGYDRQVFLRPSRYCPSDHLVGFAVAEFGTGQDVRPRVAAITDWIRQRIGYLPGSSSVHDSAEDTLLTATGTCRDFAHLGIALCRATGVPARFAAVYAPGLSPMDFHAVFETLEYGKWCVHDATGLAPRQSLVRVVTGRDAADTAFLSITSGIADLEDMEVSAIVEPMLPVDDHQTTVSLA